MPTKLSIRSWNWMLPQDDPSGDIQSYYNQVKQFIQKEASKYAIKVNSGHIKPIFKFYDKDNQVVEEIKLEELTQLEEIIEILRKRGFLPMNKQFNK